MEPPVQRFQGTDLHLCPKMASNNTVDSVVSQDVPEAEARQATDPRPADLLLPHEPSRQCEVDDSVVASAASSSREVLSLIFARFPRFWYKGAARPEPRNVIMGEDSQSHSADALRR